MKKSLIVLSLLFLLLGGTSVISAYKPRKPRHMQMQNHRSKNQPADPRKWFW